MDFTLAANTFLKPIPFSAHMCLQLNALRPGVYFSNEIAVNGAKYLHLCSKSKQPQNFISPFVVSIFN
jgi:hypothetical protein